MRKRLRKSSTDRAIAGVCGGIAEYFGISSLAVRLIFIFSPASILIYLIFAPDRIEKSDVEDFTKEFFHENIENPSLLDMSDDRITLNLTGTRALVTGEFLYGDKDYLYVMKMEFDNGFKKVNVFELRLNDVEINLE